MRLKKNKSKRVYSYENEVIDYITNSIFRSSSIQTGEISDSHDIPQQSIYFKKIMNSFSRKRSENNLKVHIKKNELIEENKKLEIPFENVKNFGNYMVQNNIDYIIYKNECKSARKNKLKKTFIAVKNKLKISKIMKKLILSKRNSFK